MKTVLGVVCVLFGGFGWLGQTISWINFPLAQKLGLQEKSAGTDPLFRLAELNAARWDSCVLWSLIGAGVLMLIDNPWWPHVSLVAGGVYLDTAGREAAKYMSLRNGGVRVGDSKEVKTALFFYGLLAVIALWVIVFALGALAA